VLTGRSLVMSLMLAVRNFARNPRDPTISAPRSRTGRMLCDVMGQRIGRDDWMHDEFFISQVTACPRKGYVDRGEEQGRAEASLVSMEYRDWML